MAVPYLKQDVLLSCHQVLDSVRSSNLHFSCRETPYSLYITVRKNPVSVHHEPAPQLNNNQNKAVLFENSELRKEIEKVKANTEKNAVDKELIKIKSKDKNI